MRFLPILLITGAALTATIRADAQDHAGDEGAIRSLFTIFSETLNQRDIKTWSRLFTEDADFVVVTGRYLKGRDEIETYHAQIWAGVYKDSRQATTSLAVRFLAPDIAVARAGAEIVYNEGKDKRTVWFIAVLTKHGTQWLIDAAQTTLTGGSPVTPVGGGK